MSPLPDSVLAALRRFDTPTILNVIELFDAVPRTAGYTDRRITACFPHLPPMVGYAVTATFRAGATPRSGDVYAGLDRQVRRLADTPGPKVVVFQDLDDPTVAATFGEVMCTTYRAFGCVGLVTSGTGRDLDQVQALDFPCFTGGTVASHGYCQIVELDVPVRVGGVWVNPGDLLHGDRNGVAVIPHHLAAATAAGCPGLADAEAVVLNYLKGGNVTADGFVDARQECSRRIRALSERLKAMVGPPLPADRKMARQFARRPATLLVRRLFPPSHPGRSADHVGESSGRLGGGGGGGDSGRVHRHPPDAPVPHQV